MKTRSEIEDFKERIQDAKQNRFFGMTYEEGLIAALEWVLEENDEVEEDFLEE